nr:hypothetical protein [Tanacetum cinerariifolium]
PYEPFFNRNSFSIKDQSSSQYGIGLVCHGGELCGDVSEERGGQLDEGLDIGGGGSVFGSGVFFRRHGNENESTK